MKRIIINAACIICFVLAALPSNAQQAKTRATEVAAETEQKPAATAVQQSPGKSEPVVVSKPFKAEEPKQVALKNAPAENSNSMKNIDRPKTSTIQPDKKERPLANEGPKAPEKQQ
jgi:hypothetical protein